MTGRIPLAQPLTLDFNRITVLWPERGRMLLGIDDLLAVVNARLAALEAGARGLICAWSGAIADIPPGWALCDGRNGTPDLRDKFVVGARQDARGVATSAVEGVYAGAGGSVTHTHGLDIETESAL